jgi:hypothetical protein
MHHSNAGDVGDGGVMSREIGVEEGQDVMGDGDVEVSWVLRVTETMRATEALRGAEASEAMEVLKKIGGVGGVENDKMS